MISVQSPPWHGSRMHAAALIPDVNPFEVYFPAPPLARFVQCLWIAQGSGDLRRERVLPNGVVEVIINFGARHKVLGNEDFSHVENFDQAWVAGIQRQQLVIEPYGDTDLLGIRFRPGGARPVLGLPLLELTDRVIELGLLGTIDVRALRERLFAAASRAARFRAVEQFLLKRLDARLAPHPAVEYLCRQIATREGDVRIGGLVAQTGYSERRIRQLFERDVGYGAKMLAAVLRFQRTLRRVAGCNGPSVDWGRVASDCAYFDQAHFNHEFRRLSGVTPGDYLASRLADINHVVVD